MNTLVSVRGAQVTLGVNRIFNTLDFVLREGEHTVLHGRNGSGKSTLLRLVRGELAPDLNHGEVCWHTPQGRETFAVLGQRMSALVSSAQLENYVSKGWRITGEAILLTGFADTPLLYGEPSADERETVQALAERLHIKELLARELPTLSHGQIRLLLLARACVREPRILLLDEFTDGLDRTVRSRVNAMLEQVAEKTTLLVVAHRMDALTDCITRSVHLVDGRIVSDAPRAVLGDVGGEKKASRSSVVTLDAGNAPLQAESMQYGWTAPPLTPPLIDVAHANVYVDGTRVLHDVSWQLYPGQNWAIIGHNGAGKSTFLRLLCGVENVAAGGSIHRLLPGQGEGNIVELAKIRRGIGIVSDKIQATYWYDLTGEELVLSGFERSVGLFHEPGAEERQEVQGWLARLGVAHLAARRMRSTSTGQLRRLMLARALVGKPDIVLLDEPFSGLDPESRTAFMDILDELAQASVHFVLVTHHEADIFSSINHVAYLDQGRMVRQGVLAHGK